ncbi:hypothetical protein H4Q26_016640 [Puccinia striiformis f. sp. tritici PST-130]|nr:hypothetical protein H4Q26_016640 [Puccinia striiformis f. sp. tritici PST-130]
MGVLDPGRLCMNFAFHLIASTQETHRHVHRLQPRMFANSAAHGAQGFKASESAATGAKASNALSDGLELVGKGGAGGSEGFRAPSVGAAGGGAKDIHSPQILPQSDAKLAPLPKDRTLVDPKDAPTDPGLNLNPSSSNAPKENFQPPKRTTPLAPKEEFNTQAPTPKELPKENPPPTPEITPAPVEPPGEARALDTTPKLGDPNGALAPGAKPPPRKLLSLFDESRYAKPSPEIQAVPIATVSTPVELLLTR